MAKSETPHVYEAIASVAGELSKEGILKNKTAQGYKFRGIDDIYNTIAPMLYQNKLVIIPRCIERTFVERVSKNGTAMFYVTVKSEFDFVSAVDGSKHTACTYGEAMDTSDKATNKAMSAAYKYAAFQTFCIPTEAVDSEVDNHQPTPVKTLDQLEKEIKAMIEEADKKPENLRKIAWNMCQAICASPTIEIFNTSLEWTKETMEKVKSLPPNEKGVLAIDYINQKLDERRAELTKKETK
jgi:hypothetical protein